MLFTFFRREQVYVPDDVLGGGERAVLEARALGVRAVVEPDNPKLAELLGSPVYDHAYHAAQLRYALGLLEQGHQICRPDLCLATTVKLNDVPARGQI